MSVPRRELAVLGVVLSAGLLSHVGIFGDGLNGDAASSMETTRALIERGSIEPESVHGRRPPLLALAILPFAWVFGLNEVAVHAMQLTAFLALLVCAYFAAREFAGRAALLIPAFLALDPVLYSNMSEGRGLALLDLASLLMLWCSWRAAREPWWFVGAGIAAAAGYFAADSAGYVFLVAAAAGLVWRLAADDRRSLLSPGFLAGGVIFATLVGAWVVQNIRVTGSPWTSQHAAEMVRALFVETPVLVAGASWLRAGAYLAFWTLLPLAPFLARRLARAKMGEAIRAWRATDRMGSSTFFLGITFAVSTTITTAFLLHEPGRAWATIDAYRRYVGPAALVAYLAIAAFVHAERDTRRHRGAVVAVVLASAALLAHQWLDVVPDMEDNRAPYITIETALAGEDRAIWSDAAWWFRHNIPSLRFEQIETSFKEPELSLAEVPAGAPLLLVIYAPPTFDRDLAGFRYVHAFDPAANAPAKNTLDW